VKQGAFIFVVQGHLPYYRQVGRWSHGEERIHDTLAEIYIPLLGTLSDLAEHEVPARLTLGISPILAEQLADPTVIQHFETFVLDQAERASRDVARFDRVGDLHAVYLAHWYEEFYNRTLATFRGRFNRDLLSAARRLQDSGHLEILASAATHAYLPLLSRDSSVSAQITTGLRAYQRQFGRTPRSFWLPECAYRPASRAADGTVRPGIEEILAEQGLSLFFAETHAIVGGRPVGKAMNEVIGPYSSIPKRYLVPPPESAPTTERTTSEPYWAGRPGVAVLGRNSRTGLQVWSVDRGYPGDFDYREFDRKDGLSGLRYWRVTGPQVNPGVKDWYHPDWAEGKVSIHAHHFARVVEDLTREYHERTGRYGVVAAIYDAELFGHWWFEGMRWLGEVQARLARSDAVELSLASAFVDAHPPTDVVSLPESSWGMGGNHFTWDNVETHWIWPVVHEAEERMERLASQHPQAAGTMHFVLSQAARELLLLQASDWPFLITTGQGAEYAIQRFRDHAVRFDQLATIGESGFADDEARRVVTQIWERDMVFPDVDYRDWSPRGGAPASFAATDQQG